MLRSSSPVPGQQLQLPLRHPLPALLWWRLCLKYPLQFHQLTPESLWRKL